MLSVFGILFSVLIGAASFTDGGQALWLLGVSRLPRTFAALLVGAGLALAGVVVQQSVQNRLVEPGLTGTPEAASIGLLVMTVLAPGAALIIKMGVGALTALVGTFGFLALAAFVPRRDPVLLTIVGMIYAGILGAAGSFVAWNLDLMQLMGSWRLGEFSGVLRGRYEWLWLIAGLVAVLYLMADRLTLLGLGDVQASVLGLNFQRIRLLGLTITALIVSVIVVTVGMVPFIGLIVPNLVSRISGDNLRRNIPLSAWAGALAVLYADILGRLVRYPYEIPAATIFALLGSGVFLWMLYAPSMRGQTP